MKPWVYISSPYSAGDQGLNTRCQLALWNELMDDGIVLPFAPLWSHFQHIYYPRSYEEWIAYDVAILSRMDALLRVNAVHEPLAYRQDESAGADIELRQMHELAKPFFYNKTSLYEWVEGWRG